MLFYELVDSLDDVSSTGKSESYSVQTFPYAHDSYL